MSSVPTAAEVRRQFIDFFVQRCGHTFVPSSPVVPHDDPTLMFTNAGMNQFKPIFLGTADRGSEFGRLRRAVNSQKCIRAGGKHNDLDDVGKDTYHHTFFEMLGNWSFGDYFKKEAIAWAWELLTKAWGVDPRRLHATYFGGSALGGDSVQNREPQGADDAAGSELPPDHEARDLWLNFLPPERVHPGSMKDNFWEMGDTGPCGPCSEIHIDLTPDLSGGPLVNAGDPRVIEIWNLVFIQFNRGADGVLTSLPARHVDTGMGFERITALLQGKTSNYDTDLFAPLMAAIKRVTGAPPYGGRLANRDAGSTDSDLMHDVAYRVIADHIRTLTFALTDGALPSNEGRGYVLRRILRRAFRYGWQHLSTHQPFLHELVPCVVESMGDAFPELRTAHGGRNVQHVADMIRDEESAFGRTLERGIALFDEAAQHAVTHHHGRITGEDAFKLHDTYGFPIDLTELMAEERGLTVDIGEYERLMDVARERARTSKSNLKILPTRLGPDDRFQRPTRFVGYEQLECESRVWAVMLGTTLTDELREGQEGIVITGDTPFYSEQGGQTGDSGVMDGIDEHWQFRVDGTQRIESIYIHCGRCLKGRIRPYHDQLPNPFKGRARLRVDKEHRTFIMRNHTSTHVMNWALREVLGDHVQQKGSLVDPEKTRFDFSHHAALNDDEIRRIEALVEERIGGDLPVEDNEHQPVSQKEALKITGLRAVFGEKYPDLVRVVSIGPKVADLLRDPTNPKWCQFSIEFCGGTHVRHTAEIVRFRLIEESAVARGIRRVVGVTDQRAADAERAAVALAERLESALRAAKSSRPRTAAAEIVETFDDLNRRLNETALPVLELKKLRAALAELQDIVRALQKNQARADTSGVVARAARLLDAAPRAGDTAIVVGEVGSAGAEQLRAAMDSIRAKAGSAAVCLAAESDGKVLLLAAMTADVVARGVRAGDLIKEVSPLVGGRGGGKPDIAQGGGPDRARVPEALAAAVQWLRERLAG